MYLYNKILFYEYHSKGLLYVPLRQNTFSFQYKNILLYVFLNKVQITIEFENIAVCTIKLSTDYLLTDSYIILISYFNNCC